MVKRVVNPIGTVFGLLCLFVPGAYPLLAIRMHDRVRPTVVVLLCASVVSVGVAYGVWHITTLEHFRPVWKITDVIIPTFGVNLYVSSKLDYRSQSFHPGTVS